MVHARSLWRWNIRSKCSGAEFPHGDLKLFFQEVWSALVPWGQMFPPETPPGSATLQRRFCIGGLHCLCNAVDAQRLPGRRRRHWKKKEQGFSKETWHKITQDAGWILTTNLGSTPGFPSKGFNVDCGLKSLRPCDFCRSIMIYMM